MTDSQPNVLLVITDQWSGTRLGVAGHPVVETPTIDQIARNGVYYPCAYSESPICIPARRSLMTGTTPRTHGDRVFDKSGPMPPIPTIAHAFSSAEYQAYCVGKLHVYPERDRIGFDDVLLAEEGRPHLAIDDHDMYLAERGFAGKQFLHGMSNNNYMQRSWHLPEDCHATNWITMEMCKTIKRRDPTRPAFWTLSYTHPHPPLVPLESYLAYYRQFDVDEPLTAPWAESEDTLPHALRAVRNYWPPLAPESLKEMRRAYYALITHIDHQMRVVFGTLREEKLLDNTIVLICADHGDMLGDFGLYAKRVFYENSARIPFVLMGLPGDERTPTGSVDGRLVGLQDVMPTLLDLAGIEIPESCDGMSIIGEEKRETLYGEALENDNASRMIHDGRLKLIWYPAGNHRQLFDLDVDPGELNNVADDPSYIDQRQDLEVRLAAYCYGKDVNEGWVKDGKLIGYSPGPYVPKPDRTLSAQRGLHYPQPPPGDSNPTAGFPD
jgi:arylsulfatase